MSEVDKDQKEKEKDEEKAAKIRRAIWIHNELIDHFPEIYKSLKEAYERR